MKLAYFWICTVLSNFPPNFLRSYRLDGDSRFRRCGTCSRNRRIRRPNSDSEGPRTFPERASKSKIRHRHIPLGMSGRSEIRRHSMHFVDFPPTFVVMPNGFVPSEAFVHIERHGAGVRLWAALGDLRRTKGLVGNFAFFFCLIFFGPNSFFW